MLLGCTSCSSWVRARARSSRSFRSALGINVAIYFFFVYELREVGRFWANQLVEVVV